MKFSIKLIAATILTSMTTVAMATENTALSNLGLSFSGSAAITSDYRFRGITQTQNDPAIQAGFTLAHTSGLYFGLWGSNVDFGEDSPSLELDPSLGFATNLSSLPGKPLLDVGVLYYNYPSDSDYIAQANTHHQGVGVMAKQNARKNNQLLRHPLLIIVG